MSQNKVTCSVCFEGYNQTSRVPRVIPTCGHSLCLDCLQKLIAQHFNFQCPFDRKACSSKSLDNFPVNYALQDALTIDSGYEICQSHGEKKRLVCLTDHCLVCEECVFSGSHKQHAVKSFEKLQLEVIAKSKLDMTELHQQQQNSLSEILTRAQSLVRERFIDFQRTFKGSFLTNKRKTTHWKRLRSMLTNKKEQICQSIQSLVLIAEDQAEIFLDEIVRDSSVVANIASIRKALEEKQVLALVETYSSKSILAIYAEYLAQATIKLKEDITKIVLNSVSQIEVINNSGMSFFDDFGQTLQ